MKKIIFTISLALCFTSCKSSKIAPTSKTSSSNRITTNTTNRNSPENLTLAEDIINEAEKYDGVRYKYGGTTNKGMDCSGLIFTAFLEHGISLPRSSSQIATTGDWIDVKQVNKGDLLFFATQQNSRTINHVGLVTYAGNDRIDFIHSTTSAGVITSSLAERYWYFAFVQARRVL